MTKPKTKTAATSKSPVVPKLLIGKPAIGQWSSNAASPQGSPKEGGPNPYALPAVEHPPAQIDYNPETDPDAGAKHNEMEENWQTEEQISLTTQGKTRASDFITGRPLQNTPLRLWGPNVHYRLQELTFLGAENHEAFIF